MNVSPDILRLYAVTDRSWLGERTLPDMVEASLAAGATCLQLREKQLDRAAFRAEAETIRAVCRRHGAPFIVNDDVELAAAVDADGAHVGQSDLEAGTARALLGADKILGVSAETVDEALAAEAAGADYLGVGAIFPTQTKTDAEAVSFATLQAICAAVSIPVVAIGGISAANVGRLTGAGLAGVAVVSAIFAAPDVAVATRDLRRVVDAMLEGPAQ